MSSTRCCASAREGVACSGIRIGVQQALAVAGDQVDLEIDPAALLKLIQRRVFQRVRDQVDGEDLAGDFVGRQAGAVDGDRALARDVLRQFMRRLD